MKLNHNLWQSFLLLSCFLLLNKKYFDVEDIDYVIELNLAKQYDIKEVMDDILIKVYSKKRLIDELFLEAENKLHLIYIFLGILELYKDSKIYIDDGEITKC